MIASDFIQVSESISPSHSIPNPQDTNIRKIIRFGELPVAHGRLRATTRSVAGAAKAETTKKALRGPLVLKSKSLGQPGLNGRGAVFCFPFFQRFVVAAFGFYDFAGVRILVDLHLARFARA